MDHIAIDLGKVKSQICQRSADGTILNEGPVKTAGLDAWMQQWARSRIVVETCSEAFAVADMAKAHGHEVRVIPATLVKALGVGARKLKNDKRDARTTSEVSTRIDLPSVHIPSQTSREMKSRCGMRDALVQSRTKLINTVRGWLRGRIAHVRGGAAYTFGARVREHFRHTQTELPTFVERQLAAIDVLTQSIREATLELKKLAAEDKVAPRLMTLPGVGPITALRMTSTLDTVERFDSAARVASYLGLTPGEKQSGFMHHRLSITHAGAACTRAVLIQAAWSFRRTCPDDPNVQWALEIEKRRGKQIATVALARKMAVILYALWRDNSSYDPDKHAPSTAP